MFKVTIDAGHDNNSNISPTNKMYIEGRRMFTLAGYLKDALENYGIQVVLTRTRVTDNPTLQQRGVMAGKNGSDLFVSLHSNAPAARTDGSYDKTITGTEVYYSLTDMGNVALADKLGKAAAKLMGHEWRGSFIKRFSAEYPNWDWFGVIRSAAQNGCKAAFLIEHGFHTCDADIAFLMSDCELEQLASAEAKVIAEYFGITVTTKKLYRVQIGAFKTKLFADNYARKARKDGYSAFVVKSGNIYRVQVGAFSSQTNARNYASAAQKKGYAAFIVETTV